MQKSKNDPFNDWMLVFLLDLLETRHLGKSAEHLGLTPASASRTLEKARNAFGDALFTPNGRGLTPTHKMLGLSAGLRAAHRSLERLYSPAEFNPATTARIFRITSRGLIELSFLTDLVAWFREEAPGARLEHYCRSESSFRLLVEEKIDLVVGMNRNIPESLHCRPICGVEMGVVAAKNHPLLREYGGAAPPLSEFLRYRRIAIQLSRKQTDATFDKQFFGEGAPEVVATTNEPLSMVGAIAASDLLMITPRAGANAVSPFFDVGWMPLPKEVEGAAGDLSMVIVWSEAHHRDPGNVWLRSLFERWSRKASSARELP